MKRARDKSSHKQVDCHAYSQLADLDCNFCFRARSSSLSHLLNIDMCAKRNITLDALRENVSDTLVPYSQRLNESWLPLLPMFPAGLEKYLHCERSISPDDTKTDARMVWSRVCGVRIEPLVEELYRGIL